MNDIEGVDFEEAWIEKKTESILVKDRWVSVHYIGLKHLIRNKERTGRDKDKADLIYLRNVKEN